ncbi:MAG: flagellar biosynthesis protein FlhB [Candidatus Latescibacterota bacterium]|nr:flagellar biosynthesis protein FlhB [Candidatus Latescibacterota bacterium]
MAEESFQEKTEQATPKRREESAKKGQVAKSQELNSAVVLMTALCGLYMLSGTIYKDLSSFTVEILTNGYTYEITIGSIWSYALKWGMLFFGAAGPMMVLLSVAALVVSIGQVGFTINEEALSLKLQRIDPIAGAKRLISKRSLVELFKGIFKIAIVGYISYITIEPELFTMATLIEVGVGDTFRYIGGMIMEVGIKTALVLLVLAILDFAYQKWEHNNSIKMTKQEVKEEQKQTEGDPQVKMRIRSLQREAARKRMMDEVPKADVVITNPTHYAIAIKYDLDNMPAPTVIAKGQNLVAQRIKEIARENNIPCVENKPLAQTLFKAVEVGMEIPRDLYKAVAEVLAYVFKLRGEPKLPN